MRISDQVIQPGRALLSSLPAGTRFRLTPASVLGIRVEVENPGIVPKGLIPWREGERVHYSRDRVVPLEEGAVATFPLTEITNGMPVSFPGRDDLPGYWMKLDARRGREGPTVREDAVEVALSGLCSGELRWVDEITLAEPHGDLEIVRVKYTSNKGEAVPAKVEDEDNDDDDT